MSPIRRRSSTLLWMEPWSKASGLGSSLQFARGVLLFVVFFLFVCFLLLLPKTSLPIRNKNCTCLHQYTAEVTSDPSISLPSTAASERKRALIQTIPASHPQSLQIHQLHCGFRSLIIELTEIKAESLNALWRVGPVRSQRAVIRIHSFSFPSEHTWFGHFQLIKPGMSRLGGCSWQGVGLRVVPGAVVMIWNWIRSIYKFGDVPTVDAMFAGYCQERCLSYNSCRSTPW